MGCWNETCSISNLPILCGDKVKLVFLRQGMNKNGTLGVSGYTYPTDVLEPIFFPISGEYNDYGTIDEIKEDWNSKLILSYFKDMCGDTITIDGDMVIKYWTLIDVICGIERGGCYGNAITYINKKNNTVTKLDHSFVIIREDIWDSCVLIGANGEFTNPLRNKENWADESLRYTVKGDIWADGSFDIYINHLRVLANDTINGLYSYIPCNIFIFDGNNSTYLSSYLYRAFCQENLLDDVLIADFKKQWFEFKMINRSLSSLRKGWMIQPGAGSQHSDWAQHKALAETIIKICDKGTFDDTEYEEDDDKLF